MNKTSVIAIMSPSYPAAWLLFGLIFTMATAHFLSLPWPRLATVAVYSVPVFWCLLILRDRIGSLGRLSLVDAGFAGFILVIFISALIFPGADENGAVSKYTRFVPFMMITPYVLGRLIRLPDLELLLRITLFAGLALLPLLAFDRLTVIERPWRLPIFGLDHGPLLVGGLLASMLVALCVQVLSGAKSGTRNGLMLLVSLIGCVTVVLVWVMARAWLVAALAGVAVVSLSMRTSTSAVRVGLFAYVIAVAAFALHFLPASSFYGAILTDPGPVTSPATASCPILGEASCKPFRENVDSVAMRWVLYREAIAMFIENPIWGVGAARFGNCSCTGPGWFPHNTILQGLAELGLMGGGLLVCLLILAVSTFTRPLMSARHRESTPKYAFALALFIVFFTADQFQGTYFMTAGSWLMVGIAGSLRALNSEESGRA